MFYYTVPQSPIYHQITLEEILTGTAKIGIVRSNATNTRTILTNNYNEKLFDDEWVMSCINELKAFNERYKDLIDTQDRATLYNSFKIPKHSGGLRQIDAPLPRLQEALTELKWIFEDSYGAMYHTSAFAYVKGRSTIDAVKRHQQNNSYQFLKTDLTDFFGSTTKEFTLSTLKKIFPFNLVMGYNVGYREMSTAIDLAFLHGGLPQGTVFSPMLTNLLMIPIDYKLQNALHDFNGKSYIYTRYADDMLISCRTSFLFKDVVKLINDTLEECGAPYRIKDKKTRYGSRNGSNWNLGVMLNKDNKITVGHEKKKYLRAMLTSYALDHKNGVMWSKEDVQTLQGKMAYYTMVEPDYVSGLIETLNQKKGVDIMAYIKSDLR